MREMVAMQSALDRMFDETWRPLEGRLSDFGLAVDVDENDQHYIVKTDLPGVQADHINVRMDGDYLMIEAEIPEQVEEKKEGRTLVKERRYGKFSRRIQIPQPIKVDEVEANFDNGVLTLTLPKSPEVQPRQISIKAGNGKK
ncbi:MAG: Hsp20/alpha crystallin family protein [Chloroflexi bacterium]|nr:Hsp20/alpha crystallin family protein [Chloroflexota bacterium]